MSVLAAKMGNCYLFSNVALQLLEIFQKYKDWSGKFSLFQRRALMCAASATVVSSSGGTPTAFIGANLFFSNQRGALRSISARVRTNVAAQQEKEKNEKMS